jgi:hypothetical protein
MEGQGGGEAQEVAHQKNLQEVNNRVARFFLVQHTKMGKNTKWPQDIPNGHLIKQNGRKIFQRDIEYTNIFHSRALKIGFLVLQYTLWKPWLLNY